MEHVHVTYQVHVGICYAHTAAGMVDAYRFSHPAPEGDSNHAHLTAALDIAVSTTIQVDPESRFDEGAYELCPSVNYIQKTGSCNEAEVARLYEKGERQDFVKLIARLDQSTRHWETRRDALSVSGPAPSSRESMAKLGGDLAEDQYRRAEVSLACEVDAVLNELNQLANEKVAPLWEHIGNLLRHGNFNEAIFAVSEGACMKVPRQKVSQTFVCKSRPVAPDAVTLAEAHRLLSLSNPQPIGVKFCENMMDLGSAYVGKNPAGGKAKGCDMHYALVIGRQKMNGKCMLLIRDSHGLDATYATEWQPPIAGGAWVDEATLARNAFAISTLDSR
ncbi:MAG: hypothetical protein AAB425_05685, partial [Bdellovibrionota bacterium]